MKLLWNGSPSKRRTIEPNGAPIRHAHARTHSVTTYFLFFPVGGIYREVRRPEKLVFTWVWEAPLNSETMQPSEESAPPMAAMADTQESR